MSTDVYTQIAGRGEMLCNCEQTVTCCRSRKFQLAVVFRNANSSERAPRKTPVGRIIVACKRLLVEHLAIKEEPVLAAHMSSQTSGKVVWIECSKSVTQN